MIAAGKTTRLLLCALFTLAPLSATLVASPAAASPLPTPSQTATPQTDGLPIAVTLNSIRPLAPQPGGQLVLTGTLTNITSQPVSDLAVQLRIEDQALSARSTFDEYAADPAGPLPYMRDVTDELPLTNPTLAAGASTPFTISVSVETLDMGDAWQVRELGIAVTGATLLGVGDVGQLRTFVPYAPRNASIGRDRLDIAWLWPLVDRPHRGVFSSWLDDDLAPELAPGGRLATLLGAAALAANQSTGGPHSRVQDVPVTWAIDPMLLNDVNAMRAGYKVASPTGPVTGGGTADAKSWFDSLRTASAGSDVVPLPYADPDVAAEVRSGFATLLGLATTNGRKLLAGLLPTATILNADWPPGGLLDERSVDALLGDGVTSLVLSDLALPPTEGEPSETPSAHASLTTDAGTAAAVLADSTLSDAVNEGAEPSSDAALQTQRVLAEALMIEAEAPSDQRSIVITPARRWDPSPTYAASLLADTGKVPWIKPVTIGAVLATPVYNKIQRSPLDYPPAARRAELPASYLRSISLVQQDVSALTSILPAGNSETLPYGEAVLRTLSSAWRDDPVDRETQLTVLQNDITAAMGGVHIAEAQKSLITLTSHNGKFPVTIDNNLNAAVNVTVKLVPNERLVFAGGGHEQRTIPAHQALAIDFNASAKTSGVFPVTVELLTPDGHRYGTPVKLFVRSTVYGTITLVITGAATAALLVAVAIRLSRRAIAARRSSAAEA